MNIFEKYVRAINSIQAPGLPANKVAVFVGDMVFTDAEEPSVEKYVNEHIIPWAFMNGIYCKGMTHGNFVVERDYQKPEEVVKNKEEDFYLNTDILNYVYAVMSSAVDIRKEEKGTVIVVGYCGEADMAYVNRYNSVEEFTEQAEQEIECLDYNEEDE
ncbi:MAG: hypothetical protein J6V44_16545 [Methanobrevibacter sp.]|nr:hypothetical protein [Methanobrevibacter sp.]MBO7691988.1 hypothetical protein [Methanobrevibacter sp.]